jgi:hypothetical protein
MHSERASREEIEWLFRYASVTPATPGNQSYVPLLMTLPLLGDCGDTFVRQLVAMDPPLQAAFDAHAVVGGAAWALPALKVRELHRCRARALADAAAAWHVLQYP